MTDEAAPHLQVDGQDFRSVELTVLGQVREGMSLVNSNLRGLSTKVDQIHNRVMTIELAKFEQRIEETKTVASEDLRRTENELQRQINDLKTAQLDHEARMRLMNDAIVKFGAYAAVFAVVASAVIAVIATKMFG